MKTKINLVFSVQAFYKYPMRIKFTSLAVYGAFILFSHATFAQDQQVDPALIAGSWNVEPFSRVEGVPSGECIMTAEYDNGLELAFKGKEHKLTALRIKDISKGRSNNIQGFIELGLQDSSYNLQSRMQNGRIDASLLNVPAAGEIIMDIPMFRVRIGSTDYHFSSAGFDAGYEELKDCQGDHSLSTLQVVDSSRQIRSPQKLLPIKQDVTPVSEPAPVPSAPVNLLNNNKVSADQANIAEETATRPEAMVEAVSKSLKNQNTMPLAMAMPMLIPSGYSYQFDRSVDGMAPISINSDAPWEESLRQAVTEQGYSMTVDGKNIRITGESAPKTFNIKTDAPKIESPVDDQTVEAVPDPVEDVAEEVAPKARVINARNPIKEGHKWSAARGERVEDVLVRWADTAGVNTQIELDNNPVLERDFVAVGAFEVAVNGLLQDVSITKVVKPSAVMDHGGDKMTHISGYEGGMINANENPAVTPNRWRALQGTDLRKVLQRWSAEENIELVWDTNQLFYIPQSIKTTTDYPEAVALLLSQFEGHPQRPTAKLNTDPDTGRKALVVQVTDSL